MNEGGPSDRLPRVQGLTACSTGTAACARAERGKGRRLLVASMASASQVSMSLAASARLDCGTATWLGPKPVAPTGWWRSRMG
jgi:hypothetical protein